MRIRAVDVKRKLPHLTEHVLGIRRNGSPDGVSSPMSIQIPIMCDHGQIKLEDARVESPHSSQSI